MKGECTNLEKMLEFCIEIISVAYCIEELGQLKEEEEKNRFSAHTGSLLLKLGCHHLHCSKFPLQ